MTSPLPQETITLNAAKLKKNNNKSASQQHQTSVLPYGCQNKIHYVKKMWRDRTNHYVSQLHD